MQRHLAASVTALILACSTALAQGVVGTPKSPSNPDEDAARGTAGTGQTNPNAAAGGTSTGTTPGAGDTAPPGSLQVSADHQEQTGSGTFAFDGNVRIAYKDLEVQADHVELNKDRRSLSAEGSVLVVSGKMRLSGERAELDLDSQTGSVYEGFALIDPSFIIKGERLDKIDTDRFILYSGEITACDQSVPQWTLKASKARIHLDHYAQVYNARFAIKKASLLYSPYVIWPIRPDRSTGFLLPHFGSSRTRGNIISEAFFLALGRSVDATLYGEWYSRAGTSPGLELRYQPLTDLSGDWYGWYLKDKRDNSENYRVTINHQQRFGRYFRFVANSNLVKDQAYFTKYETNLYNYSNRTSFWTGYLTGNFGDYSLNVEAEDRKDFFATVGRDAEGNPKINNSTRETSKRPDIDFSRRDARLWGPLHLSFEASAAELSRSLSTSTFEEDSGDYARLDAYPKLSMPWSRIPWLSITPSVAYRYTNWSKSVDTVPVDPNDLTKGTKRVTLDTAVHRQFTEAGLELIGPRFSKIWEKEAALDEDDDEEIAPSAISADAGKDSSADTTAAAKAKTRIKKRKHLIEPKVIYTYRSAIDEYDKIPFYDGDDALRPINEVRYGFTNRFYVKRRYQEPDPLLPPTEYHYVYDTGCNCYQKQPKNASTTLGDTLNVFGEQGFDAPPDTDEQVYELLNFSFFQLYSLDPSLATDYGRTTNYTGSIYLPKEAQQRYSPIQFQLNWFPNTYSSVNLTADYLTQEAPPVGNAETGTKGLLRASLSANLKDRHQRYFQLTFTDNEDFLQRQLQASFGWNDKMHRIRLEAQGYYDLKNTYGDTGLKQSRFLVNYNAQCIGFIVEYSRFNYNISGVDDYEWRFALTLPNVGTFLDLKHGGNGIYQGNSFGGARGTPF